MKLTRHDNPIDGVVVAWNGEVSSTDEAALEDAAESMWRVAIDELIPAHNEIDWDVLRLEIWADSGRTILFPALSTDLDRIDIGSVTLTWEVLLAPWRRAGESDDRHAERVDESVERVLRVLRATYARVAPKIGVVDCLLFGDTVLETFSP